MSCRDDPECARGSPQLFEVAGPVRSLAVCQDDSREGMGGAFWLGGEVREDPIEAAEARADDACEGGRGASELWAVNGGHGWGGWGRSFGRFCAPPCGCHAGVLLVHPAPFGDWAGCPGSACGFWRAVQPIRALVHPFAHSVLVGERCGEMRAGWSSFGVSGRAARGVAFWALHLRRSFIGLLLRIAPRIQAGVRGDGWLHRSGEGGAGH